MLGFLPETCSPMQLCLSVAEGWQRRGLVGSTLRDYLIAQRPSRSDEVKALIKKTRFQSCGPARITEPAVAADIWQGGGSGRESATRARGANNALGHRLQTRRPKFPPETS